MKKLLLIDTFNFLHRAYHALPSTFRDQNGEPTNAVYGVTSMIINVLEQIKPDYAVAALDGEKPTLSEEEFPWCSNDPHYFRKSGKVGDVMRESVRAALSYARSRSVELGIPAER